MKTSTHTPYVAINPLKRGQPMQQLSLYKDKRKNDSGPYLDETPWEAWGDTSEPAADDLVRMMESADPRVDADLLNLQHVLAYEIAGRGSWPVLLACAEALGPSPGFAVVERLNSYSWMRWAQDVPLPGKTAAEQYRRRIILMVLARSADEDGATTHVGREELRRATRGSRGSAGAHRNTLDSDMEALRYYGLLSIEKRTGLHNGYRLHARIAWTPRANVRRYRK